MKSPAVFVAFLFAAVCSRVSAADEPANRKIRKADEVLGHVAVVSNVAVGYSGECPEANWALSVVCSSGDGAIDHLLELSEHCQPAGFVMCLLGVRTLDPKRFSTELDKRRKVISEAKLKVETAIGCFREECSVLEVLEDKAWSGEWLICSPIPELWETIRLDPILGGIEESANQAQQPTAPSGRG